ncbi:MAG: ATP-binding protein [Ignavibacteria bacterium]|nr:ATP-binding protein [Ignavibacteria bacterium]
MLLLKNQYKSSAVGVLGLFGVIIVCVATIFLGISLIFDIIPEFSELNIFYSIILLSGLLIVSLILLLVESSKISKYTKEYHTTITKSYESVTSLTNRLEDLSIYEIIGDEIYISKEELFGYSSEQFKSYPKLLNNIIHEEDKEIYEKALNHWLQSDKQQIFKHEYRIKDKNGDLVWIEEHIKYWKDGSGNERYTGLILNINDRKLVELKLQEAKENAEEVSRLKTKLMQNLNFELRTPLANILGLTEILRDEVKDDIVLNKINQINREGNRLIQTINSIINLSLLDASKYKIKVEYRAVNPIINDIIKEYKVIAEQKGLYIKFNSYKDTYALIDTKLFRNIINNLVDNSIKFTLEGGITIDAENIIENDKQICVIKIQDTGIGISKENTGAIFNEFTRFNEIHNGEYQGSGLGLAVAKKMVEALKGEIIVESTISIGSVFIVKLPADKEVITSEKKLTEKSPAFIQTTLEKGKSPKVLLVEDNTTNKVITFLFLKGLCNIDHAPNGDEAIKLAKENNYDLVLMDINLGAGLNGIETTFQIKKLNHYKNVPFIAVTGYAMPGDEEKLLNLGFDYYLAKPFKREQLLEIVKSALNIK